MVALNLDKIAAKNRYWQFINNRRTKMNLIKKHFKTLTPTDLHSIYKLRISVFVVEQNCPYQEVDDADKDAYHIWLEDEEGIQAYARILPPGTTFKEASIDRIIAKKRRCGLGTQIVKEAIKTAKEEFNAKTIKIEAQVYAKELYEKVGFVQKSDPFLEDGIPHILMEYRE